MTEASVTAAIPAYNSERFLGDALESVFSQTRPPDECIVVDDGSNDGTADLARSFPEVRYIRKENGGDGSARNRAIIEASGDLIAFLDSDDVWLPKKLELQLGLMTDRPELAMVYTGVRVVDEHLSPLEDLEPARGALALRNTLLVQKPYMTGIGSSGLIRTEVASKVGFDERLRASADWAFACHVALEHPVDSVPEPLVLYRQHTSSQVHLNLAAVERDMHLVWSEIFADSSLDPMLVRKQRRAMANLDLSLAASHFKAANWNGFFKYLARATARRPDRVAAAFWRRYRG